MLSELLFMRFRFVSLSLDINYIYMHFNFICLMPHEHYLVVDFEEVNKLNAFEGQV